jgi:hypothetical protein
VLLLNMASCILWSPSQLLSAVPVVRRLSFRLAQSANVGLSSRARTCPPHHDHSTTAPAQLHLSRPHVPNPQRPNYPPQQPLDYWRRRRLARLLEARVQTPCGCVASPRCVHIGHRRVGARQHYNVSVAVPGCQTGSTTDCIHPVTAVTTPLKYGNYVP